MVLYVLIGWPKAPDKGEVGLGIGDIALPTGMLKCALPNMLKPMTGKQSTEFQF
jgi:hypothetical protein